MAAEPLILCDSRDGVARLTLNRPPVNVLNIAMLEQLEGALIALASDLTVRVLILRAEGKLFSAGVDVADHTPERVGQMIPLFHRVCRALAEFPLPTIAAVQGSALGGGCELAICCDLAVMAQEAKIGQPEIQLAAFAPVAALRLPQLVGYRAAAEMLLSGTALTAADAFRLGLVSAIVPAAGVEEWAADRAARFAGLSRVALVMTKKVLQAGVGRWVEGLDAMERLYLDDLMTSADAAEGLAAFMEKRQPVWKHR